MDIPPQNCKWCHYAPIYILLHLITPWPTTHVLLRALTQYADNGRIEIDNSAAQRAPRGVVLDRSNFLFASADSGGELNGVEPEAWLCHVLERIAEHPVNRCTTFSPWNLADTLATTPVT